VACGLVLRHDHGSQYMSHAFQQELLEFKGRFNKHWLLQRHGYATPAQVRAAHTSVAERREICAIQCSAYRGLYSNVMYEMIAAYVDYRSILGFSMVQNEARRYIRAISGA